MTSSELLDQIFELVNSDSVNELTELILQNHVVSVINWTNVKKETPLHVAAGKLNVDCVQLLLEFGANPNVQDLEGKTPVLTLLFILRECSCESCRRKAVRCINILGEYKADMNIEDGNGETPLHFAAEGQWAECASALLDNKAIVGMFGRNPMLTILLERIPSVISSVFDRSIDIGSNKIHDADFEVTFDLGVILPTKTMMCYSQIKKENNPIVSSAGKLNPLGETYIPKREMIFLLDLVNAAQGTVPTMYTTILYHPLVHVFTDIKWKRLQLFYALHLAVQVIFLTAYTLFLFLLTYYDCPYVEKGNSAEMQMQRGSTNDSDLNLSGGILSIIEKVGNVRIHTQMSDMCKISFLSTCVAGFVLFCTMYVAITEMKQMVLDFQAYIRDIMNYCQLGCIAAVLVSILVALDSKQRLYFWLYPVAGVGMCLSWCQIFIQIGRLPLLSIYVDMFIKVTLRFCWSLAIYSSILIAFALSYCILFPLEPKLSDIPLALLKMLTMMVGELDYSGLFAGENKSPITSHLWYAAFIILVTLILMNLLVGMAVNDIQKCRRNAEIFVIKRRIRYLWYLEKTFFIGTFFTPRQIRDFFRKAISVLVPNGEQVTFWNKQRSKAFINGCYRVRPNDSRDASLSRETRYCIKQWLEKRQCSQKKEICKWNKLRLGKSSKTMKKRTSDPELGVSEGANVQKTRVYSTPPKLSWSPINESDRETTLMSGNKVQFNMARMERKLDEIEIKIDAFLSRLEAQRQGEY